MSKNYYLKDYKNHFSRNNADKVKDNLAAIELIKKLESTKSVASEEEQTILSKYVGWGGLANIFFDEYNKRFENERSHLKELVTDTEYQAMLKSSLTAYYTDPKIARAMWDKLVNDGFEGGNILDPSMGTGIFFMTMPDSLKDKTKLFGIELDAMTGAIAKQLFPEANVLVQGFETVNFEKSGFDLVMSNIPFADLRIADKNFEKTYVIHDYFVKKSMTLLKDQGVLAIITSTGTMDKITNNVIREIEPSTVFKGGLRLPKTAFKAIAGTDVTTDILYFQKSEHKNISDYEEHSNQLAFAQSVPFATDNRVNVNRYFQSHIVDGKEENAHVLGTYKVENYFGGTLTVIPNEDQDLYHLIDEKLTLVRPIEFNGESEEIIIQTSKQAENAPSDVVKTIRMNEFAVSKDNVVYYKDRDGIHKSSKTQEINFFADKDGKLINYANSSETAIKQFEEACKENEDIIINTYINKKPSKTGKNVGLYSGTYFYKAPLSKTDVARVKGMVSIKNAYAELINLQKNSDYNITDFRRLLTNLNNIYDEFVEKHGYINSSVNARLFETDDRYSLIASLEEEVLDPNDSTKIVYKKSAAMRKPTIRPKKVLKEVGSALEALRISMAEGRGVDFELMSSIYPGFGKDALIEELGNNIFIDVEKFEKDQIISYVPSNEFKSGDILTKLSLVEKFEKENNGLCDWSYYKKILLEVKPERVTIVDIKFSIASTWIPKNIVGKFIYEIFSEEEISLEADILEKSEEYDKIAGPVISASCVRDNSTGLNYRYGLKIEGNTRHRFQTGLSIIQSMLNGSQPTIKKNVGTPKEPVYVTDEIATANLREIENNFADKFNNFINKHEDVRLLLENTYNNIYNRWVQKTYDGSGITIEGLAQGIELRQHQKNAVQRIVEERRALLSHCVGSRKSLTMLAAGFKLKELGLVNKPLYVVPSSLTAQFGQEIMRFFPTKNVFVTTKRDFEKSRRRRFIARIASSDYDAIVIGDSQFEKMKVSEERQRQFIKSRLKELDDTIEFLRDKGERLSVKSIQGMKAKLEKSLEKLSDTENKDEFIDFEQLGIDFLFVDEAHHFKNIRPITKKGNIAGISQTTAQKNLDMEMKIRSIQEEHNGTNVVFATGTPISNSISEMFTMMNYIQPDVLKEYNVDCFDAWVGTFGLIENSLEISPTGDKYISKLRFKNFINLPELMQIYRRTADIQLTEMLDLPLPNVRKYALKTELTESQKDYLQELIERTDLIKSGCVDPSEDNMLKITSEARKLALDMRLLDNEAYDINDSMKIMQVVDKVEEIYHNETQYKGTQMIFSDLGTPTDPTKTFTLYHAIKDLLVARGIPESEIAFVHDANNESKKLQLSRKVNVGEVRILLASTEKGGTGLNVQKRMKAIHHLDVPWRPSDIIQRNGRLVRQGNIYKTVDIYFYITRGSFDNYLWQIQENKLKFLSSIGRPNPIRTAEDIDEQAMSASDFKAIATGNPYLKLQMELQNEFELLTNQEKSWKREKITVHNRIVEAKKSIATLTNRIENVRIDAEVSKKHNQKDVDFIMVIDGRTYGKEEKTLASNQLMYNMQQTVSSTSRMVTLGQYKGFELKMLSQATPYINGRILTLNVVGKNQYPVDIDFASAHGTIQRIDNVIKSIEKRENHYQLEIDKHNRTIAAGEVSETFSKANRLAYVKEKYELITPLVVNEANVSTIEEKLAKFELQYKEKHSVEEIEGNSLIDMESLDKADYSDFEDGVWEEELSEQEELVEENDVAEVVSTDISIETFSETTETTTKTLSSPSINFLLSFLEESEHFLSEIEQQKSAKNDDSCVQLTLF